MKESDLTKLGRWAIPGWIALLAFALFCILHISFSPDGCRTNPCYDFYIKISKSFDSIVNKDAEWLSALLVVAAGVPLGFVVYQAYFYLRWNSPFSKKGLPGLMSGRQEDLQVILNGVGSLAKFDAGSWRRKWISNFKDKYDKDLWRYTELLFMEAAQYVDSEYPGASFYQRHRYLHEIVHTIGACIGAVYIGFLGYVLYLGMQASGSPEKYLLFSVIALILFLWTLAIEKEPQESKPKARSLILGQLDLSANYIYSLGVLHITLNPAFNFQISDANQVAWGLLMIAAFATPWIHSWDKRTWKITGLRDPLVAEIAFVIPLVIRLATPEATRLTLGPGVGLIILVALAWVVFNPVWKKFEKYYFLSLIGLPLILIGLLEFVPLQSLSDADWGFFSAITFFLLANLFLLKNRKNAVDDMLALENYLLKLYLFGGRREKKETT